MALISAQYDSRKKYDSTPRKSGLVSAGYTMLSSIVI
jgi:hypothetical protein